MNSSRRFRVIIRRNCWHLNCEPSRTVSAIAIRLQLIEKFVLIVDPLAKSLDKVNL